MKILDLIRADIYASLFLWCLSCLSLFPQNLVLRLGIHQKLEKHRGCVNTLSFNADGDIILTGSDDRMVVLWNWDAGLIKLEFQSGHSRNVLQARMMPYTDDRTIVTCGADGEVSIIPSISCDCVVQINKEVILLPLCSFPR